MFVFTMGSFTRTERLEVSDNVPTFIDSDSRGHCRLTGSRNTITDGFEYRAFRFGLYFKTSQIGGKWIEALADGTVAVRLDIAWLALCSGGYVAIWGTSARLPLRSATWIPSTNN